MAEANFGHSLGIDAIFQYTGTGIQLFSGMIFYVIMVRLFSTSLVGAVALFVAIIGLFNIVFNFGLGAAAQHFTSYSMGQKDYASAGKTVLKIIFYGFLFSLLGFASLFIFSGVISMVFLHSASYTRLVRLLSVVLLGYILFGILNGALLGLQNFKLSAMIGIMVWGAYYFGAIFLALIVRSISVIITGWIIGIFFGVCLELVVILRYVLKFQTSGKAPPMHFLMKYSIPILFSGIISYGASYTDRFVVVGLMSLSSLGVYNFALLVASSIGFIAVPFNNILLPKFSELFGRGMKEDISRHVRVSTTLLSSIYIPSSMGVAALSPMILDLLGGGAFMGDSIPLMIIMFFTSAFVSQNILTQALASVKMTRLFILSSAVALSSNIIFSIILIPFFGLIGAALGFSSVYASIFAVLYYYSRREKIASFDLHGTLKIWASSAVMFTVLLILETLIGHHIVFLPAYILIGTAIYLVIARFVKLFGGEDKMLVLSLFPENYTGIRKLLSLLILH